MAFSSDKLIDRIKLKAEVAKWRNLAIFAFLLAAIILAIKVTDVKFSKEYIARISIEGLILEDREQLETIKKIAHSKTIKAVILHINSPGGTMTGSEMLYKQLRYLAERKPLIAIMDGVAASGGYMVAIAADQIFAQNSTITGSIGVLLQTAEITELSKKLGVNLITLKSSELKGAPSPFEKLSQQGRESVMAVLEDNYSIFVEIVKDRRKLSEKQLMDVADGRVFSGRQAVKNGLVDAIGGEIQARQWLKKEKNISERLGIKEVVLVEQRTIFQKLLTKLSSTTDSIANIFPNGILALWRVNL